MYTFFQNLLSSDSLSPHGICLTWRPELIWTHVVSDAVIGVAYFSIPVVLASFVTRRRDLAFGWMFWCFAVFILACGTTHFFSIWTLWVPDYGLEAAVKAITAVASIATAAALWPLLPKALALPSPAELRRLNGDLTARVSERDAALSELRQANAERERTEEMLRQSQKMEAIGQLTGGVAHDFNNLLAVMSANLERIGKGVPEDDRVGKAVRDAMTAGDRAAALVKKMLAFSRLQPLLPIAVSVDALVLDLQPLLEGALDRCRLSIDLDAGWQTKIDPNQFESVLLNLAVNARDAMPDGGTVTIRTRNAPAGKSELPDLAFDDHVVVEVEDTGHGMAPDIAARAFEPFFTTKPVGQGTGLGLSQAFGFVKQSGGMIRLDSAPGEGTRITLHFRRHLSTSEVSAGAAYGIPPVSLRSDPVVADVP